MALGGVVIPGVGTAAPPIVTLQAIAGARLPATLTVAAHFPERLRRGLWELRTYRQTAPALVSLAGRIFPRAGIYPFLQAADGADLTYLIPFEDLTARDRAWTLLNADPEWIRLRRQFLSYRFGLYRLGLYDPGRARSGS